MAISRAWSTVMVACSFLGRVACIEERGVWAGVVAAEAVWFLAEAEEDLKKGMVVFVGVLVLKET